MCVGDFRMGLGENPHKVKNIVTKENMPAFEALYKDNMKEFRYILRTTGDRKMEVPTYSHSFSLLCCCNT